jgi:hypothetical protein
MIFGEEISGTGSEILPNEFKLFAPYPNPFNPVTTIRFALGQSEKVTLRIYDINGRLADTLINDKLAPGEHEVRWLAEGFASGVYFVKMESGPFQATEKLILLK